MDRVPLGGRKRQNQLAQAKESAKIKQEKEAASSSSQVKKPTLRELFKAGSIVRDWTPAANEIIGPVVKQCERDICWAISFARLIQAYYNMEHPHDPNTFSFNELVESLKPDETTNFALANLKRAFKYIQETGMLKTPTRGYGKAGDKGKRVQETLQVFEDVTAEFVREKLHDHPVALMLVIDEALEDNKGQVYNLPEKKPLTATCRPHCFILVAYGYTEDRKLFFIGQNSWGEDWGVNGYIRMIIDVPCDIISK